jgi:hypothetical protein
MARFINGFFGEQVPVDQRLTITVIFGNEDYVFPARPFWDDSLKEPVAYWKDKSADIAFPRSLGPIPSNVFVQVDTMEFVAPGATMPFPRVTANTNLAIRPFTNPKFEPVVTAAPAPSPARMMIPQIPDRAIVAELAPSAAAPAPSQPITRAAGTRMTVSPEFVQSLVDKWPNYFRFPQYPQGSVSTSAASEVATPDREVAQDRTIRTVEDLRSGASIQKVAAYCVQQAPEGGASTGAMVPVDANCNCPEGFTRVGECAKPQSDSSKWWLLLLAGAGIYYWSRRK